jgi:Lrp/AsnC family leucine-responsive transcriptional regulator
MLDNIDINILRLLQDNARISNAEIARHVELAPSAVLKRIRRLEDDKIITGYETRVDRHKVGLDISSFVLISTGEKTGTLETGRKIAALPEVQDVHFTAGDFYYIAKTSTRSSREYGEFIKKLGQLGIADCKTALILDTIKESFKLNI